MPWFKITIPQVGEETKFFQDPMEAHNMYAEMSNVIIQETTPPPNQPVIKQQKRFEAGEEIEMGGPSISALLNNVKKKIPVPKLNLDGVSAEEQSTPPPQVVQQEQLKILQQPQNPPTFFTEGGLEFKLDNGVLYKKAFVETTSEFRIINKKTGKIEDPTRFAVEIREWVRVEAK